MGSELKTARRMFAYTMKERRPVKSVEGRYRTKSPNITATEMFEPGPARATFTGSHLQFLKFVGLNGTGFAYAKRKFPLERKNMMIGNIIVPNGST
jgi:hypothetical protein